MSDLLSISRTRKPVDEAPAPVLPLSLELPTRYYGRLALEETARAFAQVMALETRVGDGVLHVTITSVEGGADTISEFLNHVLYHSATTSEEASR